jgi:hypothetical protein
MLTAARDKPYVYSLFEFGKVLYYLATLITDPLQWKCRSIEEKLINYKKFPNWVPEKLHVCARFTVLQIACRTSIQCIVSNFWHQKCWKNWNIVDTSGLNCYTGTGTIQYACSILSDLRRPELLGLSVTDLITCCTLSEKLYGCCFYCFILQL